MDAESNSSSDNVKEGESNTKQDGQVQNTTQCEAAVIPNKESNELAAVPSKISYPGLPYLTGTRLHSVKYALVVCF